MKLKLKSLYEYLLRDGVMGAKKVIMVIPKNSP
jgi:hypothetical protein